ncbi:MAG: dihydroorotase family protein [Chlamydiales bacterium]|nr:dihydroorotase family protein [Chlamydiales bacterium]
MTRSELDFSGLTALPALIDPHVHFRVPGGEHKEDWKTGALAALHGGVTTVCDMPNNCPPCTTLKALEEKKELIDVQLKSVDIPLRYGLYFGADKEHFDQIAAASGACVGLKIFMGCSTGGLVIDTDEALDEAFRIAAEADMLVAVHAEDEALLAKKRVEFAGATEPALHSLMRPKEAAIRATAKAIGLARKHGTKLYILHMSTKEEVALVRAAKQEGLSVYAEATTHHLFLSEEDYATLGTFAQMNPPLRSKEDQESLWEGILDGTIDTIGTDHAPHTIEEKEQPFGKAPSGIPGVETLLPLMLDAVYRGLLTLERMIELTHTNPQKIFNLPPNDDIVLVDLDMELTVTDEMIKSKCGWTPYRGRTLRGWPEYVILDGRAYSVSRRRVEGKPRPEGCRPSVQGNGAAT